MADEHYVEATYELVDFWAIEDFDDPKYNTNPHRRDAPESNGHNLKSIIEIDPSLGSVKDALDLLAKHNGLLKKEHSSVRAIEVTYQRIDATERVVGLSRGDIPLEIKLQFEDYVALGQCQRLHHRAIFDPNGR